MSEQNDTPSHCQPSIRWEVISVDGTDVNPEHPANVSWNKLFAKPETPLNKFAGTDVKVVPLNVP